MAAKTFLLDPNGVIIKLPQWTHLKENSPRAWVHGEFENDKVRVQLRAVERYIWNGVVPKEHWMKFAIVSENIVREDFEGRPYKEPKYIEDPEATKRYRTLEEAKLAYQQFLARYTDCTFDAETGHFREVGNKLNQDMPKPVESSMAKAEDFGSW